MQAVTSDRVPVRVTTANHCIQATPDFALLFVVAQVSGAPDAARYATLTSRNKGLVILQ